MSDLFVSYSRKDAVFVRRLHDALGERGKEVWVDWQDIPPTAEWIEEIKGAIERAESFAFVISPHSLASEICRIELEHAQAHNKRIIPLALQTDEEQEMPDVLQRLNWIVVPGGEAIDEPVDKLIEAIETDLEWVKEHTRLTTLAVEWEKQNERAGYLLSGEDLDRAESQLEGGQDKEPRPTALQTRYVGASRRAATGRQRKILFATAVALILSIGLGAAALVQRNRAQEETRRAEAAARRAEAQKLVALGQLEIESFSTSALAHATKSLELADSEEARLLALKALRQGPPAWRHHDELRYGTNVKFSPDGRHLVYTVWTEPGLPLVRLVHSDGSWQELESLDTGRRAGASWQTDDLFLTMEPFNVEGSFWTLYSAARGEVIGTARMPARTQFAVWDPGRERLVALANDGEVLVSSMKPGEETRSLGQVPFNYDGLSRDGRWVLTVVDDELRLVEILEDSLSEPRALGRHPGANEAFLSDAVDLAVSRDPSGAIRVWDLSGSSRPRVVQGPPGGGGSWSQLAPNGSLLYIWISTGSGEPESWVLSIPDGRLRQLERGPGANPVFDQQASQLALLARRDDVELQRLWAPEGVRSISLQHGIREEIHGASFHPSGDWLVVPHGLHFFPLNGRYPIRMERGAARVAFDAQGDHLLTNVGGGVVELWPIEGGSLAPSRALFTKPDGGRFSVLAISPDGDRVLAGKGRARDDTGPVLFSFEDGSTRLLEDGFADQIMGVAFSPDGRYAAASGGQIVPEERFLKIWDLETLELVATHAPEARLSHTVAGFTHDNRALWSSTEGLFAWNFTAPPSKGTDEHELLFEGYTNLHTGAGGSILLIASPIPDTASLASLTLLDLKSGERTLMSTHGQVYRHALDPSGQLVASITREGVLRVGPVDGTEPHLFQTGVTTATQLAIDPQLRWVAVVSSDELSLWPIPPAGEPPLHTLPLEDLLAELHSSTNARLLEDPESPTGWSLGWDTFPGWDVNAE